MSDVSAPLLPSPPLSSPRDATEPSDVQDQWLPIIGLTAELLAQIRRKISQMPATREFVVFFEEMLEIAVLAAALLGVGWRAGRFIYRAWSLTSRLVRN